MERIILHSDINSCYANIERLYHPELNAFPVAVAGSPEKRRGIILAKDERCKKLGVKTGMAVWQARQLCPDMVVLPPRMELYSEFTEKVRKIYLDYTDICESFGLDESWLDVTGCVKNGGDCAREIRRRVREELGVTVSVGVSWNKVFAKLGSDYKKPDAVTVIDRDSYRSIVWPLPARELLYVGRSTSARLGSLGVTTIGAIAKTDPAVLRRRLGKAGEMLHAFANGRDCSPVRRQSAMPEVKSIGNGTTTPRDMETPSDVWTTLMALCESVGARLREKKLMGGVVAVDLRGTNLEWTGHQMKLTRPTNISREILEVAFELFCEAGSPLPLRSIAVRCDGLTSDDMPEQLDLLCDQDERDRRRSLDAALDSIRDKYGYASIRRGTLAADTDMGGINAREEHAVHPAGFLNGCRMDEIIGGSEE
ncbi:MAG: DNA polymerase thumb domain-containing protein [Candidatus Heteroscillospira sp.]|jgi:DNA polymerase-4